MTSKIFINFLFPENITVTTALERDVFEKDTDGFLERFCVCGVRANPSTIIDHSTSINEFPPALIDHSTSINEFPPALIDHPISRESVYKRS